MPKKKKIEKVESVYADQLSDLQISTKDPIVAIAVADIHLSHKCPSARSVEKNWYDVMLRYIELLKSFQHHFGVPILCAGDIFDKWNSPPELINFALEHLPKMYAIPGQHDLPWHDYDQRKKSAYWTLVYEGRITDLPPRRPYQLGDLALYGFPWQFKLTPLELADDEQLTHIALVHAYCWHGKNKYKDAPEQNHWKSISKDLEESGMDVIIYGDNHKGFNARLNHTSIVNCGTFMRRRIDDYKYSPRINVIRRSGDAEELYFDVTDDKFIDPTKMMESMEIAIDATDLITELGRLGTNVFDFSQALVQFMKKHNIDSEVKRLVTEALDRGKMG